MTPDLHATVFSVKANILEQEHYVKATQLCVYAKINVVCHT